ncbi:MAG: Extracellular solute-binding protein, family 7 [Desulfotomaculum sp. 46_80]|jgi:C4-dicarboxylate-binding protein DctP|nr:MAG: Extracellular solute-binding protein, family 7 [Desulfotomaculum sp. 46_80]
MKKSILFVLTIVLLTFFLVQTGLAADAEYKIRCSLGPPENHFISEQFRDWANLIKEKTDGRVEVEIYYTQQLYKDSQVIEAIQTGAIEAGCAYTFALATMIPEFEIFNMPMLFNTTAEQEKMLNSRIGKILANKTETKGLKYLGWFYWPQEDLGFVSTKEIKAPGDFKGLKIRGLSGVAAEWFKSLGASPAYISGAELYMAFQRGTVDAANGQLAGIIERKQYEVAPYMILSVSGGSMGSLPVINKKYFSKLPEDIQQAIIEASAEVTAKSAEYAVNAHNKYLEKAKELKINVYHPSEEELILWRSGVRDIWRKSFAKKPGALVLADEALDLLGKADYFK